MGYATVEDAVLARIQAISGFTTANTSKGDYRILGVGVTKAVVIQPGPFEVVGYPGKSLRKETDWVVLVELFVPWDGEISTTVAAVRTIRQSIIDELDKYPTLAGTAGVVSSLVVRGREPTAFAGESRRWWTQILEVHVMEKTLVAVG